LVGQNRSEKKWKRNNNNNNNNKIWYDLKDHNMAPKQSIINLQHHNLLGNQLWPFWIQNGHHSKQAMDINSKHHNLLGIHISSKSEDFCILAAAKYKNPPIWAKLVSK
jgi:hypothetical protein